MAESPRRRARDRRRGTPRSNESAGEQDEAAPGARITQDDAIRVLVVKGYAGPEGLATALRCTGDAAADVLDRLVADGLAEMAAGSFRLTADGKAIGHERITEDTARWGVDNALAALDGFLALDLRMKDTVTAWQMREVDGTQTFNDHTRPRLRRGGPGPSRGAPRGCVGLACAAGRGPAAPGRPTASASTHAAAMAAAGDGKYMASPRVDSYHSVWFELHEDLILLAGRNRADEVAAGRA